MTERKTSADHSDRKRSPAEPRTFEKPDHLADRLREDEDRQEALLDEALEETFPSSDPISPA
jgi:hypothetical protein